MTPPTTSRPTGDPTTVFADGSVSLRLYPHNELHAFDIVDQLCAQAAIGTDGGFDGVMTSEHHGGFAGYLPNPLQVTGFQLASMSRGWAAACPLLLPLRPLAMLAEEVAWLAARFPGRVGVGVAPGALALDFEAMGVDQDQAMPMFRTGLPALVRMLSGADLGVIDGDRALAACVDAPVPVISTAMSPPAVRRAAAAGAGVLFDGGTVLTRQRELSDAYVEAGGTGPRILIRRVWLGPPPREAFGAQLDVYRSYTSDAAMQHWRDDGWICRDDAATLVDELIAAVVESNTTCLNLRIHAPGIAADAAREQIAALAAEVVPLVRAKL
jgi:alkanesulfonate monooxygenase SsuD/methylene tetrahydromethanopterin reductase-like flavin-dependent oxidoreductase (luciferase family)